MEFENLLRPQARDDKHLKHPGRDFLAHRFKAGMRARAVELGDDIRDCVANPWNFREAILSDEIQGHHKSAKAVSRADWPGMDCRREGMCVRRIPGAAGRRLWHPRSYWNNAQSRILAPEDIAGRSVCEAS